jgi:hypothetical protein
MKKKTLSAPAKFVGVVIWKFAPTRYVPGGSVVEVTMFVVPLGTAALVLVFTRVGGAKASIAIGATL